MFFIAHITKTFYQNDVEKKSHAVPTMNVMSCVAMVTYQNFNFIQFESSKDTLWCYMKDTNLYIKCTITERCLHYLMITPHMTSLLFNHENRMIHM